jgi:hypothetical protein
MIKKMGLPMDEANDCQDDSRRQAYSRVAN